MEVPMKAIVFTQYGSPDVLQLKEVEKPVPKGGEVLVKIFASSINYVDWQVLRGKSILLRLMNGLLKPRHHILGDDIAGKVEKVGKNVSKFQTGDEVFGISNFSAFAEYACVPEKVLANKPVNMTFEEAAALPEAGITALQALLNKGQTKSGQKVLICGASGGVGTFAVQIAKSFETEVTGVCSTSKLEMLRSIGADKVIDYTQEDFTESGQRYDLILATGGYHSIFDYARALNTEGTYVCVGGSATQYFQAILFGPLISLTSGKKLGSMLGNPNIEDYELLIKLFEAGKVVPVIDRIYSLSEIPDALRYYGGGHARGKVVIRIENNHNKSI
jgi:NADPH:quinone reductase-like Zn-dependent oxidoreductase